MVNIISIASELGYLTLPDNILIDVDNLRSYPDEQTVIITTGSQGESMAALSRMANVPIEKYPSSQTILLYSVLLRFRVMRNL